MIEYIQAHPLYIPFLVLTSHLRNLQDHDRNDKGKTTTINDGGILIGRDPVLFYLRYTSHFRRKSPFYE
jgi:hypothetical protein